MPASSRAVIRAGLLDERRVARRPQADVVREDDRPVHVVVPVNRVDPVDDRDLEPALERPRLELVVGLRPALGGDVVGVGIAAAEDRAEGVLRDVGLVLDGLEIGLGHLADLLVEGHRLEPLVGLRRRGRVVVLAASAAPARPPPIAGRTAVAESTNQLKVR